jgi:hypothetical protein
LCTDIPRLLAITATLDSQVGLEHTLRSVQPQGCGKPGLVFLQLLIILWFRSWERGPEKPGVGATPDELAAAVVNGGPPEAEGPGRAGIDLWFVYIHTILIKGAKDAPHCNKR